MRTLTQLRRSVAQAGWTIVSMVSPFVGFVAAAITASIWGRLPSAGREGHTAAFVPVFFGFVLLGLIAGVAALVRVGEPTGSAWLALFFNIIAALAFYTMISLS